MSATGRKPEEVKPKADAVEVAGWLASALALVLCVLALGLAGDVWQDHAARIDDASSVAASRAAEGPRAEAPATGPTSVEAAAAAPAPEGSAAQSVEPEAEAASGEEIEVRILTEGQLARGETLARAFAAQGVAASAAHVVARAMSPVFNFRYARPGDRFVLSQDQEGRVLAFDYVRSPLEQYTLRREGEDLVARRDEPEVLRRRARVAGVVSSSLYDAVVSLGEQPALAGDVADIFAWDVDFARQVQPGDEFAVLYERRYLADEPESYLGPGRVLAARYATAEAEHAAIYFEPEEGRGGYYRRDGSSVERQFLKAPLSYRRISSGFAPNRIHPILKVRRPHLGVDYAAATGTPVWAVADGEVVFIGRAGGLGRTVKVRHRNGYTTYYGHLSRPARGLRVGQRVQQKQVVGYVGSSGLATGPHLHFTLKRHGRYVNPATLDSPSAPPLPKELYADFAAVRDARLAALEPTLPPVVVNEAM